MTYMLCSWCHQAMNAAHARTSNTRCPDAECELPCIRQRLVHLGVYFNGTHPSRICAVSNRLGMCQIQIILGSNDSQHEDVRLVLRQHIALHQQKKIPQPQESFAWRVETRFVHVSRQGQCIAMQREHRGFRAVTQRSCIAMQEEHTILKQSRKYGQLCLLTDADVNRNHNSKLTVTYWATNCLIASTTEGSPL